MRQALLTLQTPLIALMSEFSKFGETTHDQGAVGGGAKLLEAAVGAEGSAKTNTGAVDPLATSKPPNPSNFPGTSGESPTAASKVPDAAARSAVEAPSSPSLDDAASAVKQSAGKVTDAAKDSVGGAASQGSDSLASQPGGSETMQNGLSSGGLEGSLQAAPDAAQQQVPGAEGGGSFLDSLNEAKNSLLDKANESASSTADSFQGQTLVQSWGVHWHERLSKGTHSWSM